MKLTKFIPVALSMILVANTAAYAGLDNHFDSMFDALAPNTNVTEPGAYMTARRGVISMGAIETRSEITHPNLINFDPPSFNAGCNGISLHGGALSFINGEEFQNNLRAIAANATGLLSGYVFKMALSAMCEDCERKITELADKINAIGRSLKSSCQAAKMLVAQVPEVPTAWTDSIRSAMSIDGSNQGVVGDVLEGLNSGLGKLTDGFDEATKRKYFGNVLWQAFKDSSFDTFFPPEVFVDEDVMQLMLSLAGSVIIDKSSDSSKELSFTYIEGTLDPARFMGGGEVTVLKCDEIVDCMKPDTAVKYIRGFYPLVREMLFGESLGTDPARSIGIIAKFRSTDSFNVFDSREKAFMSAMKPNMIGLLAENANRRNVVSAFGDDAALYIAEEVTARYIELMLGAMETALASYRGKEGVEKTRKRLDFLRSEVAELHRSSAKSMDKIVAAIKLDSELKDKIRNQTVADK